ncbi:hypothetical protein V9T40_002406 [Parthenolecanium corni]|uniref:Uncharacterized protein n=1 Tax=Parthenolecanium corni TaxID=536013 RepID=A0AAN9Y5K5_9HEMI
MRSRSNKQSLNFCIRADQNVDSLWNRLHEAWNTATKNNELLEECRALQWLLLEVDEWTYGGSSPERRRVLCCFCLAMHTDETGCQGNGKVVL